MWIIDIIIISFFLLFFIFLGYFTKDKKIEKEKIIPTYENCTLPSLMSWALNFARL